MILSPLLSSPSSFVEPDVFLSTGSRDGIVSGPGITACVPTVHRQMPKARNSLQSYAIETLRFSLLVCLLFIYASGIYVFTTYYDWFTPYIDPRSISPTTNQEHIYNSPVYAPCTPDQPSPNPLHNTMPALLFFSQDRPSWLVKAPCRQACPLPTGHEHDFAGLSPHL